MSAGLNTGMRPGARQLAQRRQLLVATAQLQRAELRLAWRQAPWYAPLHGAFTLAPALLALWRRLRRGAPR